MKLERWGACLRSWQSWLPPARGRRRAFHRCTMKLKRWGACLCSCHSCFRRHWADGELGSPRDEREMGPGAGVAVSRGFRRHGPTESWVRCAMEEKWAGPGVAGNRGFRRLGPTESWDRYAMEERWGWAWGSCQSWLPPALGRRRAGIATR